jgi:Polysaccharide deacetylase
VENPRADYSAIYDRPALPHPDGARVLIWPVINVEQWDINSPMARTILPAPQGREVIPDITNYGWFDYGLRVGFWRLKRALDERGIRATLSLNAVVCDTCPALVQASVASRWEILAHGYVQRVINAEPDERDAIRRTLERITAFTGSRPRGWMGPGLAETFETPDILAEEGVEYVCDWCNDDQPYDMRVRSGRLVSIPYTVELNDITIYACRTIARPSYSSERHRQPGPGLVPRKRGALDQRPPVPDHAVRRGLRAGAQVHHGTAPASIPSRGSVNGSTGGMSIRRRPASTGALTQLARNARTAAWSGTLGQASLRGSGMRCQTPFTRRGATVR